MSDNVARKILSRQYEPEVDGLRALAVLVVLLFHAGFKSFRGGFVGVDIFFVISGYLITRNILSDIAAGTFSYTGFYTRRIRRIFPAMLFTMVISGITGILVFSPLDLERFARSMIYACAALQNIYFWTEAGYWDASKNVKPLLHFWSLGVEEQFYLFWPLILLTFFPLSAKRGGKFFFGLIFILSAMSFASSLDFLKSDSAAVFYLTPFRVFEFGIGALTIPVAARMSRVSDHLKEIYMLLAFAAIAYSVRRYSESMPFPGKEALLPCVGAAVIIAARDARYFGRLLRNPLSVGIGLISYSLYLVHWPIFVFYRYYHLESLSVAENAGLIVSSMAAAALMYRYVECPFRYSSLPIFRPAPAKLFAAVFFLVSVVAVLAAHVEGNPGWSAGMSREIAVIEENTRLGETNRRTFLNGCATASFGPCSRKSAKSHYVLLGDSYGEDVGIGLYIAFPDREIKFITDGGCKALLGFVSSFPERRVRCMKYTDRIFNPVSDWSKYDGVILSMAWTEIDVGTLGPTISFLKSHGAKQIIVAGPKITLSAPTSQILARSSTLKEYEANSENIMDFNEQRRVQKELMDLARKQGAEFLDIAHAECPHVECPNLIPGTLMPIIWDTGHWTLQGSRYVGQNIKNYTTF